QIERFQGGSNVGGSVAEISDGRVHVENVFRSGCHLSVVSLCPGISGGQRHASTNDGVGAYSTCLHPLQVHGTAATPAETGLEAEDLRHGGMEELNELIIFDSIDNRHTSGAEVGQPLCQELV